MLFSTIILVISRLRWPGSTHNATVWSGSKVKPHLEQQRCFLILGDAGYPISEKTVTEF